MTPISQATTGSPKIEVVDRRTISQADAGAISELIVAIWPKVDRTVESYAAGFLTQWNDYRGPEDEHPRSFVIRHDGRVVAHASADPRTICAIDGDITVLALARVCTDPSVRGMKLGDAIVRATFELVDRGPFPFALFQTSTDVCPFYERLGAVVIDNTFINSLADNPQSDPFWAEVRMRYPAAGDWPKGEIDVRGPGW